MPVVLSMWMCFCLNPFSIFLLPSLFCFCIHVTFYDTTILYNTEYFQSAAAMQSLVSLLLKHTPTFVKLGNWPVLLFVVQRWRDSCKMWGGCHYLSRLSAPSHLPADCSQHAVFVHHTSCQFIRRLTWWEPFMTWCFVSLLMPWWAGFTYSYVGGIYHSYFIFYRKPLGIW